ncbi:MAG TPA: haloacid dehalogenase-like hydrolase [Streptosporangiaceae bacterium]
MTSLLVLWDVDHTLINAGGAGVRVYEHALRELFGLGLPATPISMAGRTDRSIAVEILMASGVADPRGRVDEFQAIQAAYAPQVAQEIRAKGKVLPGVGAVMTELAARGVVQSLLTGNVRELAIVKLGALGVTEHLDLDAGAYGTASEIRADLVPIARANAAARYGADFGGEATVLVGDTPLDVAAALAAGARAVGVATGGSTLAELTAAGAHAVLPDLSDTAAAVAAILGLGPTSR